MRIAAIVPNFYPYFGGGVEKVAHRIYRILTDMGIFVEVYSCNSALKRRSEVLLKDNFKVITYPCGFMHFPSKKLLKDLNGSMKFYDILHVFNIHNPLSVSSIFLGSLPMVISPYYHGRGHTMFAQLAWKTFYKKIVKKLLERQKGIIVNSLYQKRILIRDFALENAKFYLVYDGLDLSSIENANSYPRSKLGFDEADKILLCVSRLEKYKNIHLAIMVLKYLPPEFKLVVVGSGSKKYENQLKKLISELSLQKRVRMLGFQPDEVVWSLYKTADLFLQLSEIESFGMTCIEALAAGTPVIVNDDKGGLAETAEIFGDYIRVCNAKNLQDLANLILELSELKPVKVDEVLLAQFNWEEIARRILEVYREIAYGSGGI
jgi:glycosyltransferase involved in cell wall biosynthesis